MTTTVLPGASVRVAVPATSANLGPGFDSFGLALDWRDSFTCTVTSGGYETLVTGEGAGRLPAGADHLVISALLAGLHDLDHTVPGLRLEAHNTIPHGRGLGSSAAAIVGGLLAARALSGQDRDDAWLLRLAAAIEGHPDNVAAAVHGGFVIAYAERDRVRAVRCRVAADLAAVVLVPGTSVPTSTARGLLPDQVPHLDAARNAARAGLLVHALAEDPELLLAATEDWLHTRYRRSAMPDSYELTSSLRRRGHAAVISGAGPSVLVLGSRLRLAELVREPVAGFAVHALEVGRGAEITPEIVM